MLFRSNKHSDYWKENIPYSINYSKFKLRRIFSNEELNLHGRFYGGWWQSLPERFRQHITIDGRQTVEVDYSDVDPDLLANPDKSLKAEDFTPDSN